MNIGTEIARRDWMKAAGITGAATLLSGPSLLSADPVSNGKPATKVRGVIFMVSDGMSPGVLSMAESFSHMTRQKGTRWWSLYNDRNAARGLMDTASANSLVTDSAAASSAWGGGKRVNNGSINVDPDGKSITPIGEILHKKNARVGLVSTATITHATPAGFAASTPKRGDEDEIASQYLNRVDIALGGGSGHFSAKDRGDKRDLSGEFAKAGYGVVSNREGLLAAREEKLLGTFTRGHLPFTLDRMHNEAMAAAVPTLSEMSTAALNRFLPGDKPFILQIEGARVDHAAHLNDIAALLYDQLAFDDALATVLALTEKHNDILVVVTSDHGNGNPGLNGMGGSYEKSTRRFGRVANCTSSYERLFSEWKREKKDDTKNLTKFIKQHLDFTLTSEESEALLNIFHKNPVIEWNEQLAKPEGLLGQFAGNRMGVGWTGTTHTSDYTITSAYGPQSDRFSGIVKNSDVFGHLVEMLG